MAPRKTESALFHQLSSPESLMAAWKKVRANKGGPGLDLITIQQFERNLVASLEDLSLRLREERYYPMPIRRVQMEKASGGKRELGILTVEDRIVQRAALDTLEPLFEREFLDCSFGFRPNRSVQDAIHRVLDYLIQRGTSSYEGPLYRDLEGDPDLEGEDNLRSLARKEALQRMGRDGILLLLTYARGSSRFFTPQGLAITASSLLAAAALPIAHQVLRERMWRGPRLGTVQGGVLSPLLSNVYLHQFDRAMVQ